MKNRIISTDTGSLCKLKDTFEALDYIAASGFKFFDLSLYWESACDNLGTRSDYIEKTLELKNYADKLGLICIQSHSYFTSGIDKKALEKRYQIISQDIKITKLMGANLVIAHPVWELSTDENVKFLNQFLPLLKELDMKLAIENVWGVVDEKSSIMCSSTPDRLKELMEKLNDDHFTICLDIGHAEMQNMKTSSVDFIRTFKDKISTLHIHDNDTYADLHQIPYTYAIDFDTIFDELKNSNYKGPINFEVERCYSSFPKELYVSVLRLLKDTAEYWRKKLDE